MKCIKTSLIAGAAAMTIAAGPMGTMRVLSASSGTVEITIGTEEDELRGSVRTLRVGVASARPAAGPGVACAVDFPMLRHAATVRVVVAGLFIGWIETMVGFYLGAAWQNFVPYLVVLLVMVVRPTGLFGERWIERI